MDVGVKIKAYGGIGDSRVENRWRQNYIYIGFELVLQSSAQPVSQAGRGIHVPVLVWVKAEF